MKEEKVTYINLNTGAPKTMKSSCVQVTLSRCLLASILIALVTATVIWVAHTKTSVESIEEQGLPDVAAGQSIYTDQAESDVKVGGEERSPPQLVGGDENSDSSEPEHTHQLSPPVHQLCWPDGLAGAIQEINAAYVTQTGDESLVEKYRAAVDKAQKEALNILQSTTGWTKSAGDTADGKGVVHKKDTQQWGTIFKLAGTVNINAELLYEDLVRESEQVPTWNPTQLKVQVLNKVDNSTEIAYNIAASGAGGWISSRDFVYARHWEKKDGWYVISSVSIKYPPAPPHAKYVRGVQNPGAMRLKEINTDKLLFEWLLNIDLKGSISSWIVNSALSGTMVDYLKHLRAHAATLPTNR